MEIHRHPALTRMWAAVGQQDRTNGKSGASTCTISRRGYLRSDMVGQGGADPGMGFLTRSVRATLRQQLFDDFRRLDTR